MNKTITRTSFQGHSLANGLYEALDDFYRAFNRPPRLISLPWFRRTEIDAHMIAHYGAIDLPQKFAGIPFRFTDGEVIELQ